MPLEAALDFLRISLQPRFPCEHGLCYGNIGYLMQSTVLEIPELLEAKPKQVYNLQKGF